MNVQFGMKCNRCSSTSGVIIGGGSTCTCGGTLAPAENAPEVITNFNCRQCGTQIGMLIGGSACPSCGTRI